LQARVEIVAQVVLDPLGAADDREARAQPRDAVGGGEGEDQQRVAADGCGDVGGERLDRALDRPRNAEAGQRGDREAPDAQRVAGAVSGQVVPDRAWCGDQRGPSANGLSAA
jgi:hypothetical protein